MKSFDLQPDEQILRKVAHVQRGRWGANSGDLILTNKALVYVDRGLLGNVKGYTRFELYEVNQVLVSKESNTSTQLEVYHLAGEDDFGFQSNAKHEARIWKKAIDEQLVRYGKDPIAEDEENVAAFIGDVVGSVAETGGAILGSMVRGVGRAAGGFMDGLGIGGKGDS